MKTQLTEEQRKNITQYAITQIAHISKFGCNGIKCKYCAINKVCENHEPAKSKDLAQKVITYARLSSK